MKVLTLFNQNIENYENEIYFIYDNSLFCP